MDFLNFPILNLNQMFTKKKLSNLTKLTNLIKFKNSYKK